MVSTRRVVSLVRPDAKVKHLAVDETSACIVWAEGSQTVKWATLDAGGELGPVTTVTLNGNPKRAT